MFDLIPGDTFERIQNLHHRENKQLDEHLFERAAQIVSPFLNGRCCSSEWTGGAVSYEQR